MELFVFERIEVTIYYGIIYIWKNRSYHILWNYLYLKKYQVPDIMELFIFKRISGPRYYGIVYIYKNLGWKI